MTSFYRCYGLETVCLRYFNIFGPRQDPTSPYSGVLAKFITQMLNGEEPTIFGDGEQSRDFTYVDNAVHANLLAARRREPIAGEVLNVGCGTQVSVNALAQVMAEMLGTPGLRPVHEPERAGDLKHSFADLERLERVLDYRPSVDCRTGREQAVRWYQADAATGR